mmetsp:Transcript_7645/g.10140  ORF Transcript_7645/g.10140 Transcript_7645/m.10140 type:complete len:354 (+) Transcript_7645:3-1064(+)
MFLMVLAIVIAGKLISTLYIFDHELELTNSNQNPIMYVKNYFDLDIIGREDAYSWTKPCSFRPNSPQPVVLFALGRSGSSITWDTMSALTGQRNIAYEITGGNPWSSIEFFDQLQNDTVYQQFSNWTIQRLCHVQRKGMRKDMDGVRIAGFQWKPFASTWNHPYAIKGLEAIAAANDPIVKVVYLRRNPLDVKASNLRHTNAKLNSIASGQSDIPPHCKAGDIKCQDSHSQFSSNIVFPTGSDLLKLLKQNEKQVRAIHKRFEMLNIPFVEVSYEKLYGTGNYTDKDRESAEEWMKLFQHLGVGPQKGLTMEKVQEAFSLAPTNKKSRNETIDNFEAVAQTLTGTKYEHYLVE